jgi:signal transduction histidine kinase/CheY-like chemotaxis protein
MSISLEQESALLANADIPAFAHALNMAGVGFWELDCSSGSISTSWQHDRIFGCNQPCGVWQLPDWHAHIFNEDRDDFAGQLAVAKLIGTLATECRIKRKDGALRWIAVTGALRVDVTSKRRLLGGVVIDITDSRHHEPRVAVSRDSDFADSIFITQMNHEIRTPLYTIQGFNFLLQKSSLTPGQQEYVRKVDTAAQILLSTLDAIADYSKIEIGALEFDNIDFRIDHVLEEVTVQLAQLCESKSARFSLLIAPDVPLSLHGDPRRLRQILLGLSRYALNTMRGGAISLSVLALHSASDDSSYEQALLYFSLCDTGTGLSAAQMERAFDAFHHSDPNARGRSGTDIGAAVSKRVIEVMGGTLTLNSALGKGSEFNFSLPFALSASTNTYAAPTSFSTDKAIADVRVLLVDDDSLNLLIGRAVLQHFGVRHIDTATTGLEAVELVEKNGGDCYQLILMDLQMPVMDGHVAAREIRRCPGAETLTIVAMTADVAADSENCFIAGMNEFMTKPISIPQLGAIIERRLGVKIATS